LAVLAVPLVGAGSAQAALAGANPLTTTNRPDLRTVMLTSTSTAQFCFDQTVTQIPSQTAFSLGGYGATNFFHPTSATVDATNDKCVDASFPISIGDTDDLKTFSIGQVGEGAVNTTVGSGFVGNRADSTALTGSSTHNGTAGHTVAPDLTGVVVDNANTLDYIYDENVQTSTVDPTKFTAYYQDGVALGPVTGVVAGGNVVKVTFGTPLSSPVDGPTVIAVSFQLGNGGAGAVKAQNALHAIGTIDSSAVAGTAGATTKLPDLTATTLSTDGTFVDFQFDEPVAGACAPASAACVAGTLRLPATANTHYEFIDSQAFNGTANCVKTNSDSKGAASAASGACGLNTNNLPQLPNNVVRAFFDASTFGNVQTFFEYGVKAAVSPGAAQTAAVAGNGYGSSPIGGNQGAFAAGFTTGPDAFKVTFDTATNTATVLFDQRVFGTTPSSFVLLDTNGNPLPGGSGVAAGPPATAGTTPGSYLITVSFTGASVANANALEIKGPEATPAGMSAATTATFDGFSVQQIVSPTGAAAVLKPSAKVLWVKVAIKHHKHHKRHKR
jgi:hypothetical protein